MINWHTVGPLVDRPGATNWLSICDEFICVVAIIKAYRVKAFPSNSGDDKRTLGSTSGNRLDSVFERAISDRVLSGASGRPPRRVGTFRYMNVIPRQPSQPKKSSRRAFVQNDINIVSLVSFVSGSRGTALGSRGQRSGQQKQCCLFWRGLGSCRLGLPDTSGCS